MSDFTNGRNSHPTQIMRTDTAVNRLRRKTYVALPPDLLTRLARAKLFSGEGVAAKLCLTLYAVAGVHDRSVDVTYDALWPLILGPYETRPRDRLIDARRRLEATGLAVRQGTAQAGYWFELDRDYDFRETGYSWRPPVFVSARLWSVEATDPIRDWSGPELGIYLWLALSQHRFPRRAPPRSSGFVRLSAAPAMLNLTERTLRAPLQQMATDGLTVTIQKDRERWIQLVNPDLWPVVKAM